MKRLYATLVERWGEPTDVRVYDARKLGRPSELAQVHVPIWAADDEVDVCSFCTLGMSERLMAGADYRVELTMGVRAPLDEKQRADVATFLANITEYPFMNNLRLDWWERLANPGTIPSFPDCSQVLFAPSFGEHPFLHFEGEDADVRLLSVMPITPRESHVLKAHGREAFLQYWEDHEELDLFAPRRDPD
jgi:hypothetical protein